ncbi:hypothetical protein EIP86_009533 [Pleurotus ostreatoroseus]|nr:hypothetical protein EIP86_009533 [Pleurotus ostreatoroseus]
MLTIPLAHIISGYIATVRLPDVTALEWQAIELVSTWLYLFREATTQMSATHHNTLQNVRSIFVSLQDEIKTHIARLPPTAPPILKDGLLAAYRKLSDYFNTIDQSPFYLWACLLDPRISEEGLKAEASTDVDYLKEIEESKAALKLYYEENYVHVNAAAVEPLRTDLDPVTRSPRKFDFLKRYKDTVSMTSPSDEFAAYFRLRRAAFDEQGEPLKWWATNRHQFPTLARLARDILSIPGMYIVYYPACTLVEWCSSQALLSLLNEPYLQDEHFLPEGGSLGFGLRHIYPLEKSSTKVRVRGHETTRLSLESLKRCLKGGDAIVRHACDALGLHAKLYLVYTGFDWANDGDYTILLPDDPNLEGCTVEDHAMVRILQGKKGAKRVSTVDMTSHNESQTDNSDRAARRPQKAPDVVYWITKPNNLNTVKNSIMAYGNQAELDYAYGYISMVVDVGKPGARSTVTQPTSS